MTSFRRLGCTAVLTAAVLVPTVASSAHANGEVFTDAEGDVTAREYGPGGVKTMQEPSDTQRDVVRVNFFYRKDFAIAVIGLKEVQGMGKGVSVRLRLKSGGVDATFARGPGDRLIRFGQKGSRNCPGGLAKVDPERDVVRFKVPARCFGTPDQVRFGVIAVGTRGEEGGSQGITSLIDDARTTRVSKNQGFSPRLGAAVLRD